MELGTDSAWEFFKKKKKIKWGFSKNETGRQIGTSMEGNSQKLQIEKYRMRFMKRKQIRKLKD